MADEQQPQTQPSFQIEKIYVKDLSLEIPNAPQVFVQQAQPQLEVQLHTEGSPFAEGYYEVSVSATVTAKAGERTLFLAEAVQAGIFSVRNVPQQELDALLGIGCPTILVPVPARDHLGSHHARRIPAGPARSGVVRGALRPAHAAGAAAGAAAGRQRAEDRTRPVKRVAVLGAGAWGTAIAAVLCPRLEVALWMRDPARVDVLSAERRNERYLPGVALASNLVLTSDFEQRGQGREPRPCRHARRRAARGACRK